MAIPMACIDVGSVSGWGSNEPRFRVEQFN